MEGAWGGGVPWKRFDDQFPRKYVVGLSIETITSGSAGSRGTDCATWPVLGRGIAYIFFSEKYDHKIDYVTTERLNESSANDFVQLTMP